MICSMLIRGRGDSDGDGAGGLQTLLATGISTASAGVANGTVVGPDCIIVWLYR